MTTDQREACLTGESMERLAQGELQTAELSRIEVHIESCEYCRRLLESAAFDSFWNNEVLPVLRIPSDVDGIPCDQKADGHEDQELESVLKLLGPTDDPHKLGRIGIYEVVGIIGRGGMGVVFKAFDAALNRFVAIKMLLPHLAVSGAARKRFAREGQAAAAVIDDNVLPIYSVAEWQGVPYLVTQYSRGVTLQKRVQDQGPLELKEILRIGMQTARGLAAAHAQGLVHRDVKPSNILLDGTVERALLTDFGLARAVDDASITRTGIIAGTPQYMSPEQARGGSVDTRSDLFGLGCVLYTMCTGRPPFRAENSYAVLRLITDAEPRPIQEVNPDIPDWLCEIVSKLMAKSPADRFESAGEVATLLEQSLAHVQQPATVELPEQLRVPSNTQKSRRLAAWTWMATAVAITALGLLGFVITLSSSEGTILIESAVDDVRIQVTQSDKVVRELTVTKAGQQIRVAAGTYEIVLEGNADGIAIENGQVNLRRGGTEIVKLTYQHIARTTTPTVGSTTADWASSEQLLKLMENTVFVSDVRSDGQVLDFTLKQRGDQNIAKAFLEIQFRCEKPMPFVWTGPAPDAATVVTPQHTVTWIGTGYPMIPLPLAAEGHKVAFIFPDNDSAVLAAKQLAAIGDQSLLDSQRRANSIDGRLQDDGIIFGEHAAIGKYTTHFRVLLQKDVPSEQAGHGIQRPQFVGVNWRPLYLAVVTHPNLAKRYSLSESQQQEIRTLFDDFVRTATVDTHDDLLTVTQAKVQDILTREQVENLQRDIWVGWNVTKFLGEKILDQLQLSDEQQKRIDAIWLESRERHGPFQEPAASPGLTAERLAVAGPTEWQRVFDEIFAILAFEQRAKFLREIQDPLVDAAMTDPRQRVLAVPKGAVREVVAPPDVEMAMAFPTVNWRQVYIGKAMETRFARRQHLTAEQQQRMHDIVQVFLRNATPATRSMDERRAQSAIQNLLTTDQDRLLRREIWVAMNATRLRVPTTHEQLGLNSEQRRQIDDIWSKLETEVRENGGRRADGSDSYERIFDEIFDVLTSEQRRLYLFKFQDPVFHSGTQPIPFGVDGNPDDFPAQEKDPPRLIDVLNLHLRRERERFPLLDHVLEDIRLLEGGGLEILERPVLQDREQYAKDHPELAKAFEAWQNDYRDVLRATEIIPELFQEETRPVMVTVARLLIQSEDIPGVPQERLAFANQELGEYPTDKLVERVFLELAGDEIPNLQRELRESGANLPHTGTHEDHLRIAEKEKTYLLFARMYCGIEESEMFRQIRKLQESVDPATEFLFEESHAIPNDKALSFLSRRGHEEIRHRERAYHALPKDSVTVNWRVGEEEYLLRHPDATVITHAIIDRRMDGHVLWKCYGIPKVEKLSIPATWFRRDPFPALGNHGGTRNCLCRMEMELASYEPAQRELALSPEQQQQINAVNVAGIPFNPSGGLNPQSTDAHDRIIQILRPEQRARLAQLLLQRLGLAAFDMDTIREVLEISAEQQRQIQESWKEHAKRVQDYDVTLNDQHIAVLTGKIDASQLKASIDDHQHQKFASDMRVWNEVYLILDDVQRQKFETLRGAQVTAAEMKQEDDTGAADSNMQNSQLDDARVQMANQQLRDPHAVLLSELQGIWLRTAVVDTDGKVIAYDKPAETEEVIYFKDSTVVFHQQGNDEEAPLKFALDVSTPTPLIDIECPDGQFSLGFVEVRNGTLHLQLGGCGDDRPGETSKPKLHAQYRRMPSSLEALCHQSEQGAKNLEDLQREDSVVREANRQLKDPNAVMSAALQGSWILTGMTTGQEFGTVSNPLGTGHRIEFDMSRVVLHQGPGVEAAAGTFVLDTSLTPVEIDIKSESGLYTLGFIELKNGTLDLRLGTAGGDRPGKSDKPTVHYQYRRKPAELKP